MNRQRTHRLAPGYYEVETDQGTFTIERRDDIAADQGGRPEWFITWPGEHTPDGVTDTLREAKANIARYLAHHG